MTSMVTGLVKQGIQQDKPVIRLSQPPTASRSRRATCDARFTGAPLRELNKTHSVITIEDTAHVYRKFLITGT
jgi:hypothetical protein